MQCRGSAAQRLERAARRPLTQPQPPPCHVHDEGRMALCAPGTVQMVAQLELHPFRMLLLWGRRLAGWTLTRGGRTPTARLGPERAMVRVAVAVKAAVTQRALSWAWACS